MKIRLTILTSLIFSTILFQTNATAAKFDSVESVGSYDVVKAVDYTKFHDDEDELIEDALEGNIVEDEYIQVEVEENSVEDTKTIEITKKMNSLFLENGQEITEYEKSAITLASVSGVTTDNSSETWGSDVKVKVLANYSKITINNTTDAYRLNFYSITPSVHVALTTITSITHEGRSTGPGYYIDGSSYKQSLTTGLDTWTNPSSSTLTKITHFTKFNVSSASGAGYGIGVSGTVKYKNTRYGTTESFGYGFTVK